MRQWPRVLPQMQFYMNRRVNRAIGCSPFEAMFGRRPAADIDRKLGETQDISVSSVDAWRTLVAAVQDKVLRETIYSAYSDKERLARAAGAPTTYEEGDLVLVYWPQTHKWECAYKGPYAVIGEGRFCPPFYTIAEIYPDLSRGPAVEMHVRRMRKYCTKRDPDGSKAIARNIATGEYVVENILRHREIEKPSWCRCKSATGRHVEWEVAWAGLTLTSWEPAMGLTRLPIFKEYNKANRLTGQASVQGTCERSADRAASKMLAGLEEDQHPE